MEKFRKDRPSGARGTGGDSDTDSLPPSEARTEPPDELRYGILTDARSLPRWQIRCLEELDRVPGVRLELLIQREVALPGREEHEGAPERPAATTPWDRVREWIGGETDAVERVSLADRRADVKILSCRSDGPGPGRLHRDDLERVRGHDLDFILRLDDGPVRGGLLRIPSYGVWAFRHGDPTRHPPSPPGFWEILRGEPVTVGVLRRLRADPGEVEVLFRGRFRTVDDSWLENRDAILLGSAPWPARVCREILLGTRTPRTATPATREVTDPVRPDGRQTLAMIWRLARNYLRNLGAELFRHEQWSIGLLGHSPEALVESEESLRIRWLPPVSRRRYRADPFGVEVDGALRVMAEEFDHRARVGRLVSFRVDRGGRRDSPETPGPAAERSAPATDSGQEIESPSSPRGIPAETDGAVHVSYPYLFRHEGSTYCVPETSGVRAVRLYRARDFPDEWEGVTTLVEDFAAVDPTIFRHDDRWWLLCTDLDRGSDTHLHAWWAAELTGPWTPHPLNPLKTDVCSSRPAGTPFRHGGALYRPAQDCSTSYGAALVLNRVVELSPARFREVTVRHLRPDPDGPYPDGLHTLSSVGDRTLVDGKRYVFVPEEFRRRLLTRLRSLLGRGSPEPGDGPGEGARPDRSALSRRPGRGSKPRRVPGAGR